MQVSSDLIQFINFQDRIITKIGDRRSKDSTSYL